MRFFAIVVFIFVATFVKADVLSELSEASRSNPEIVMEILQTKRMSFFDETIKSKMIVAVSNTGKMRMQTVEPFEAISIFDGNSFARFEKSNGRWHRLDGSSGFVAKRIFEEIRSLLSGNIAQSNYEISIKQNGSITLVPKSESVRKAVASIEIFTRVENGTRLVDKISILDTDGDKTVLEVLQIKRAKFASEIFDAEKLSDFTL